MRRLCLSLGLLLLPVAVPSAFAAYRVSRFTNVPMTMVAGKIQTPSPNYNVRVSRLANGDTLCYGRHKMQPTTAPKMRHAVFNVPVFKVTPSNDPAQSGGPVIQISIDSNAQGSSLLVTSLSQTVIPGAIPYLQIGIDAITPDGSDSAADFWCNITVIGALQ
jgi:hypothetical protein